MTNTPVYTTGHVIHAVMYVLLHDSTRLSSRVVSGGVNWLLFVHTMNSPMPCDDGCSLLKVDTGGSAWHLASLYRSTSASAPSFCWSV